MQNMMYQQFENLNDLDTSQEYEYEEALHAYDDASSSPSESDSSQSFEGDKVMNFSPRLESRSSIQTPNFEERLNSRKKLKKKKSIRR